MSGQKKKRVFYASILVLALAAVAGFLWVSQAMSHDFLKLTEVGQDSDGYSVVYDAHLGNQVGEGTVVAEQWQNGECVRSTPVMMTEYVEKISLWLNVRKEENRPAGVDIQIETNQYGGSMLTYFAFPEEKQIRGWAFTSYEQDEKAEICSDESVILAALVLDMGNGVRVFDCKTLVTEPQRLENADYMVVIRAAFSDKEE